MDENKYSVTTMLKAIHFACGRTPTDLPDDQAEFLNELQAVCFEAMISPSFNGQDERG